MTDTETTPPAVRRPVQWTLIAAVCAVVWFGPSWLRDAWSSLPSLLVITAIVLIFGKPWQRLWLLTCLGCIGAVGLIVWTAQAFTS